MTNRHFHAIHHGTKAFANDQWIGEHYSDEQACEAVMDRFKRLVEAELEMVELRCCSQQGPSSKHQAQ